MKQIHYPITLIVILLLVGLLAGCSDYILETEWKDAEKACLTFGGVRSVESTARWGRSDGGLRRYRYSRIEITCKDWTFLKRQVDLDLTP